MTKRITVQIQIVCVLLAGLPTLAAAQDAQVVNPPDPRPLISRPISDADGVLAIFVNWSRGIAHGNSPDPIVFAAWPNGYVVWSDNQVEGGPPYHEGRIDPKKYEDAVSRLEADGIFENQKLNG